MLETVDATIKEIYSNKKFNYNKLKNEDYLTKDKNGITILEHLLINDNVFFIMNGDFLMEDISSLYKEEKGKSILEYFMDKGYKTLPERILVITEDIARALYKNGLLSLLGRNNVEEDILWYEIEPDITILDILLKNNINIEADIYDEETAQKYMDYNHPELLINCRLSILLNEYKPNVTYLKCLLDKIKSSDESFNLNKLLEDCNMREAATFYLILAKENMLKYAGINESILFKEYSDWISDSLDFFDEEDYDEEEDYEGKYLLDMLLDMDLDTTVNIILTKELKSNLKVASVLKSRGIKQNDIAISVKQENYAKDYLKKFRDETLYGPLPLDAVEILEELRNIFYNDKISDHELIDTLVDGYSEALYRSYNLSMMEIRNLIKIKKENADFYYKKTAYGTNEFDLDKHIVYCDKGVIRAVMHETAHALHYYLENMSVPDGYDEVLQRMRKDPEILRKVEKYIEELSKVKNIAEEIATSKLKEYFEKYYTPEKKFAIQQELYSQRKNARRQLEDIGISKEVIDDIIACDFTAEEYIKCQKRIFVNQYKEDILNSKYSEYGAISDVLDAVYLGKLRDREVKSTNGNIIEDASGHGILYYSLKENGFAEMIANFSTIVKTCNERLPLEVLRNIIGEELFDMLSKYYCENILNIQENVYSIRSR